jgi:hypothetical protein
MVDIVIQMKNYRRSVKLLSLFFLVILMPASLLVFLEFIIGRFNPPTNFFDYEKPGEHHLYRKNLDRIVNWAPVPYILKTNSFGMRSPEPIDGYKNIFALGQSVTDGFYVDTAKNWPSQLSEKLKNKNLEYNILNLSKGGGSFYDFYLRIEYFQKLFKADGLIVQISPNWFINNPANVENLSSATLFSGQSLSNKKVSITERLSRFFVNTAIGELIIRTIYELPSAKQYTGERSLESERTFFKNGGLFEKHALRDSGDPNLQQEVEFIYGINYETKLPNGNTYQRQLNQGIRYLDWLLKFAQKNQIPTIVYYNFAYHELYSQQIGRPKDSMIFSVLNKHMTEFWPEVQFIHSKMLPSLGKGNSIYHLQPYDAHPNSFYYGEISDLMVDEIYRLWN